GYFMMPLHPLGSDVAETLELDLSQVERCDALGYCEAWVGEHFTAEWENIPAPDQFIAAALQRTKQIVFGTGVSCMPNHSPFVLAHRIAQLDQLARGRFIWGIGTGSFVGDLEMVGIDPRSGKHRILTLDAVDLVVKLWTGQAEPGLYEQHNWRFTVPTPDLSIGKHVYFRPYQQPHPPIAVAGVSERSETLTLAGERGWIPMSINLIPSRVLATHWDQIEAGATSSGKTADRTTWRIARDIHVAETTEQARDEALNGAIGRDFREYFLRNARKTPGRLNMYKQDPDMTDDEVTPEYLLDTTWIVGDPDEVARKLRALYHAVGGFGTVLAIAHDWPDRSVWDRSMTLLAERVLPQLADLT
ncbi:MAG: LLM class flavin-dependent oxidoreductase, partial [Chloroflexi bacterium]|nr:LLM class flavin-dependent oxidoreductase [Chloroflexota bacterium]